MNNSSKYKKTKGVNKNVVAEISHNEYKDVCWKMFCSCCDDKSFIHDNGINVSALGH